MRTLALLLLIPLLCGMVWPSVFWVAPDNTYAFEMDFAAYPRTQLRLWVGDGKGWWAPTSRVYRLVLDHSWWSEWKGINTGDTLWLVHSQNETRVYLPDVPWRTPPLWLFRP